MTELEEIQAIYRKCKYGDVVLCSYPPQPGCSKNHYPVCCNKCDDFKPKEFDGSMNWKGVVSDIKPKEQDNVVNHPKHYNVGKIEVIDVIEDWQLGFCLGNAIKYIGRAGHKDNKIQDLEKAKWYLEREIENCKKGIKDRLYNELNIDNNTEMDA